MVKKKEARNILDMIPIRKCEWEENDIIKVMMPRFKSRIGKRFCKLLKKKGTYKIKLDKRGSEAWKLCDGKKTVKNIADELKEKFGEEVEPAYERVAELMNIMESNGLITYKKVKNNSLRKGGD